MAKKTPILSLEIEAAGWRKIPRLASRLEEAARATLDRLPAKMQFPCTITVLLSGNTAIRRLNRDFRGMDKPTNVLSFPQFDPRKLPKKGRGQPPMPIGDIAMAYQYIVGEAKKDNNILINHVVHLLIHGILHLFGYHHSSDIAAVRMERLEKRVMAALKLPDPYAPRVAQRKR